MANKHEIWLKERENGIGGSECAGVIGLSPYFSALELWEIKTGKKTRKFDELKVRYGKETEDALFELFKAKHTEFLLKKNDWEIYRNPKYPFIFSTPDATIHTLDNNLIGVWEAKTSDYYDMPNWKDKIPDNYFCQILNYFNTMPEIQFVIVNVEFKKEAGVNGFKIFESILKEIIILRKNFIADANYLLQEECYFWACVEQKVPPKTPLKNIL